MIKVISTAIFIFFCSTIVLAQNQGRDELERQRQQLKKDLETTQKLLNDNKERSKESYSSWLKASAKVEIQEKIIDNINDDIEILNNNLVKTQRDINRYDRILDTLRQEYAKSMVYAYNNRGNYDFINFIFSSRSFNDAIKRIGYLKTYRNYREMQGQNILRTQELRKQRLEELTGNRQKKSKALKEKDIEMANLQKQQEEKDRILAELKKQGKDLNNQLAASRSQLRKVDNAINAAIKKAIDDARKQEEARKLIAKKAAEEERKRQAAEKAAADRAMAALKAKEAKEAKEASDAKANAAKNNAPAVVATTPPSAPKVAPATPKPAPETPKAPPVVAKETPKKDESILINAGNVKLNTNFENNKGLLPWPVDNGIPIMHYGRNQMGSGAWLDMTGITISSPIGTPVRAVFEGTVLQVVNVEDIQVVTVQCGKYFVTYGNLLNVSVSHGQQISLGQIIGKVAANLDGVGAVDFYINVEKNFQDPERWLRRR